MADHATAVAAQANTPHPASDSASAPSAAFYTVLDEHGLAITLPSSVSPSSGALIARHLGDYSLQVLQYGRCWDVVLRAITISLECAMAHVLAADFWIAKNDISNAIRSMRAAESLLPAQQAHLTPRESAYVAGYGAMLSNQLREALVHFQRALDHSPGDLFAVKKVQLLAFVLGGRPDMLAVALRPDVRAACDGKRFFLAMLGFALEENERFDEAATAITQALTIDAHDPWAIHVQAHLLYARGAQAEGAPWLEERAHAWEGCMSFLYSHCWFHLALLRQDADETDAVLGIFDHAVWPHHTPDQADEAAAPAGPVPLAVKRLQQRASASASAPASASADQSQPLQQEEEQSFGVTPTPLSFQRHDRFYVEDQNGALNLLWRLEMRMAGAGSLDGPGTAGAGREQKRGPLRCAALSSRWVSITATLALPPAQPLSLFGLLQLHALCRVGKLEEARQFLALLQVQVAQVADPQRRAALGAVLLPLAEAIVLYHSDGGDDDGEGGDNNSGAGVARAFALVHRLLVEEAPHIPGSAATSTADTGVDTKQGSSLPQTTAMQVDSASASTAAAAAGAADGTGAARRDPSAAEMSAIAAACAVSSYSPALAHASLPGHAARLSCLAASGEQLEVLVEWYVQIAAEAGRWTELRRVLEDKLKHRGSVQWYHRLDKLAQENIREQQESQPQ